MISVSFYMFSNLSELKENSIPLFERALLKRSQFLNVMASGWLVYWHRGLKGLKFLLLSSLGFSVVCPGRVWFIVLNKHCSSSSLSKRCGCCLVNFITFNMAWRNLLTSRIQSQQPAKLYPYLVQCFDMEVCQCG